MYTDPKSNFAPPEINDLPKQLTETPITKDWLMVIAAGVVVGIIAMVWLKFAPKRRRRHHRHHRHHHHHELEPATPPIEESSQPSDHGHGKRRRRWGRRNPTLAQTGGLPPLRPDGPIPPPENP